MTVSGETGLNIQHVVKRVGMVLKLDGVIKLFMPKMVAKNALDNHKRLLLVIMDSVPVRYNAFSLKISRTFIIDNSFAKYKIENLNLLSI